LNFCWQFSRKVLLRARRMVTKWAPTTQTLSPIHGTDTMQTAFSLHI
jgi:hypothetical protein